jgi:hypothetical protein
MFHAFVLNAKTLGNGTDESDCLIMGMGIAMHQANQRNGAAVNETTTGAPKFVYGIKVTNCTFEIYAIPYSEPILKAMAFCRVAVKSTVVQKSGKLYWFNANDRAWMVAVLERLRLECFLHTNKDIHKGYEIVEEKVVVESTSTTN